MKTIEIYQLRQVHYSDLAHQISRHLDDWNAVKDMEAIISLEDGGSVCVTFDLTAYNEISYVTTDWGVRQESELTSAWLNITDVSVTNPDGDPCEHDFSIERLTQTFFYINNIKEA